MVVNILSNNIGTEQADKLIAIMASQPNLKTLCGFSGDETELDLSGKSLGAGCATLLAPELNANGALAILNIMGSKLGKQELEKFKAIKETKQLQSICGIASDATEADLSGLGMDAADAAVLAEDIQDKGALVTLDISNNEIGAEGAKLLAPAFQEW